MLGALPSLFHMPYFPLLDRAGEYKFFDTVDSAAVWNLNVSMRSVCTGVIVNSRRSRSRVGCLV
jgi:hypothetical protein